jgi:glucans biosynthesis protein
MRRPLPAGRLFLLAAGAALAGSPSAAARGAEETFDFEALRFQAQQLALHPYVPQPSRVPSALLQLTYDQYRDIRFDPAASLWRRAGLPFQLQFFHPGFIFNHTVQIDEVDGRIARPISFSPELFDYGQNSIRSLPETMGFAGFRLLYALNKPGDELGSFLGASYFRMICRGAVYGLSARGLAINTAEPDGEEFPAFQKFWIERPSPISKQVIVYALLDSPSVTGAYSFVVVPGDDTVMHVRAVVYCRQNPNVFGLAPLTTMFWHGKNTNFETDDFRPEVHDSDGLMMETGSGEWIWRPLTDPPLVSVAQFSDERPRGFGLLQRERRFESYEDLESAYQLRPSAWIEPVGDWGRGSVRLVELPTPDETSDNVVAFWAPNKLPEPGTPIPFEYNLHWFIRGIQPPAGYVVATRHGRSRTQEPDLERFVVDFDGRELRQMAGDPEVEPVITVGQGAVLVHATAEKNPYNGTWRAAFAIRPDGHGEPVEMRCFLKKTPDVLTETWSYLWRP